MFGINVVAVFVFASLQMCALHTWAAIASIRERHNDHHNLILLAAFDCLLQLSVVRENRIS